jgi:hypothetical protein
MKGQSRGASLAALPGLLAFVVGAGLLASPWWSKTLPASDYPLVIALGAAFAGMGAFAALPDSWPRLRTLALTLFMATFGTFCAALMLAPFHPDPDGTYHIGGIAGFATSEPMPMWARLVAAFFAIVCLVVAALGAWGLVRGTGARDTSDGET